MPDFPVETGKSGDSLRSVELPRSALFKVPEKNPDLYRDYGRAAIDAFAKETAVPSGRPSFPAQFSPCGIVESSLEYDFSASRSVPDAFGRFGQ